MKKNINILFVSTLCSNNLFEYILKTSSDKSGQAIQKFHELYVHGLALLKSNTVETLSSIPVISDTHERRLWNLKSEHIDRVKYNYVPMINLRYIKNIIELCYSFFRVLFWKLYCNNEQQMVICDVLKPSISVGAFCACKIRGIKIVGVVTDMPGLDVFDASILKSVKTYVVLSNVTRYDGYILITKQMNNLINPYKRPNIVMEGLVNHAMTSYENKMSDKDENRILLYAGGIYERYGIKTLIEAFMMLKHEDVRLHIYGAGPMADEIARYSQVDNRIQYKGIVSNETIVLKQIEATLLINPRPSIEEYTQYSFPSKNMEYMVSGTPVVTTHLPGMPDEYIPYVYLFEDESKDGLFSTFQSLLEKPQTELHDFGRGAKEFVLTYKSNIVQAEKTTVFLNEVLAGTR